MQQDTITKLHCFIAKLVVMLEDELDELKCNKSKSAINVKKNVTDTLNKLVKLIMQLNKLSQAEDIDVSELTEEDQEIIGKFLEKYCNK